MTRAVIPACAGTGLTSDGTNAYSYTAENLLKSGPGGVTLRYDALGRLHDVTTAAGVVTRFQYGAGMLVGEYGGTGARRDGSASFACQMLCLRFGLGRAL